MKNHHFSSCLKPIPIASSSSQLRCARAETLCKFNKIMSISICSERKSERTVILKRKTTSIGRYTVNLVSARSARAEELHVFEVFKKHIKMTPKLYQKVSRRLPDYFWWFLGKILKNRIFKHLTWPKRFRGCTTFGNKSLQIEQTNTNNNLFRAKIRANERIEAQNSKKIANFNRAVHRQPGVRPEC